MTRRTGGRQAQSRATRPERKSVDCWTADATKRSLPRRVHESPGCIEMGHGFGQGAVGCRHGHER